jgi:peptidoglycan/LPS O-acetylase OafA/YrhL
MMKSSQALQRSARVTSLDGLRGLAAVVVLVHHALLAAPVFAAAYYGGSVADRVGGMAWAFIYTPLHLIWAGTEAVYLFFVLSGVVLTFPILRSAAYSWRAYYPSRLLRLYGPIVFAVLLGGILFLAFPRRQETGLGQWMMARGDEYPLIGVLKDLVLVFGASGVISPLWSLRWEIIFSLLLPIYVVLAKSVRALGWLKCLALLVMVAIGAMTGPQFFLYLPMFGVGVLAAMHWETLSLWSRWLQGRSWAWPVLLISAVGLTCIRWEALALGVSPRIAERLVPIALLGVMMLVFGAAFWRPAIGFLNSRMMQWVGGLSFSLYLVHEPILIATRLALPVNFAWQAMLLGAILAFSVAWVFERLVKRPTHRLAKAVAQALNPRTRRGRPARAIEPV